MLILIESCDGNAGAYRVDDKDHLLRLIKEEFGEENLNDITAEQLTNELHNHIHNTIDVVMGDGDLTHFTLTTLTEIHLK